MVWLNGLVALISLLTIFKAPAKPLWYLAVGVTEWGHMVAFGSLLLALLAWKLNRSWGAASWLALIATILYLTPLIRAMRVAQALPNQLNVRFGAVSPREAAEAPIRSQPLSFLDLYKGISSPTIRISSHVYATRNGVPLSLDLYEPATRPQGEGLMPAIVVVHGGSWQSGKRGELSALSRYLAARGYLVASIDYRFAPQAHFPAQRDDLFEAISYLKNNANAFQLDKNQFVLLGRSAGGQIALSAAYDQKDPAIKGVIVFYTPNDLLWGYSIPSNPLIMNSQRVIERYLGGTPSSVPDNYRNASPLLFVNATTPPTLMIHGDRDELVWEKHDERLSKRLEDTGRPYFYLRLPWATHGCDANFSGPSGQLSTYAVERFLAYVVPSPNEVRIAGRSNEQKHNRA
jgi:acetyl esterase/lipase